MTIIDLKSNIDVTSKLSLAQAGKIYTDPELENGSYRYRVETKKIIVIVAFMQPNHIIVVSAWRI